MNELNSYIERVQNKYDLDWAEYTEGTNTNMDALKVDQAAYLDGLYTAKQIIENTPRFQLVDIDGNVGAN